MQRIARQRHYNHGSQTKDLSDVGKFLGFTCLVIAGLLIALVAANLGSFHTFVMLILTSPLWGGAALLLKISE